LKKSCIAGDPPAATAIFAVQMLEEWTKHSGTVSVRFFAWSSRMTKPADLERLGRVEAVADRDLARLERQGGREDLEQRAQLVGAAGDPVEALLVARLVGPVRVEVGQAHERHDLARGAVEDEAARPLGPEADEGREELLAHDLLHAQVEGEGERPLALGAAVGGEPVVERPLHAGEPAAVDVDEAHHVAGEVALGVDALERVAEPDPRDAELQDLQALGRGDLVPHPREAALRLQPRRQLGRVHALERGGEHSRGRVLVGDGRGVGVERGHLHVRGQEDAVPVGDLGPGRRAAVRVGGRVGPRDRLAHQHAAPPVDHVEQAQADAGEGEAEGDADDREPAAAVGERRGGGGRPFHQRALPAAASTTPGSGFTRSKASAPEGSRASSGSRASRRCSAGTMPVASMSREPPPGTMRSSPAWATRRSGRTR
jgi:hypothetical protein